MRQAQIAGRDGNYVYIAKSKISIWGFEPAAQLAKKIDFVNIYLFPDQRLLKSQKMRFQRRHSLQFLEITAADALCFYFLRGYHG
jgi:hypothetical protein